MNKKRCSFFIVLFTIILIFPFLSSATDYYEDNADWYSMGSCYNSVYYDGKIFISFFEPSNYDPHFIMYNGTNWTSRQKVGEAVEANPHAKPSLNVNLNDGRIHYCWGGHDDALKYVYSDDDGDTWSDEESLDTSSDYRMVYCFQNDTVVIHGQHNNPWYMVESFDNGDTWLSAREIANYGIATYGGYHAVEPGGVSGHEHLWMVFYAWRNNPQGGVSSKEDIVVCYYNQTDRHMYGFDDTDMGVSLSEAEMMGEHCLVDGNWSIRARQIAFDYYGCPVVTGLQDKHTGTPNITIYRYSGGVWSKNIVVNSNEITPTPQLYIDDKTYYIYANSDANDTVADGLEVWKSTDNGTTWSYNTTILAGYDDCFPDDVYNDIDDAYLNILADDKLFVYGDSGFVVNGTVLSEDEIIEFLDINSQTNNSVIYSSTPTINWTVVTNASQYHLEIDNNADFSSPTLNYTNINEYNYPVNCDINATRVSFTLPDSLPSYDTYYMRVRAYTR